MDLEFIKTAQQSPEVRNILSRLRIAEGFHAAHPVRVAVVSDLTLLWAALADAAGTGPGGDQEARDALLEVARRGSKTCSVAVRMSGKEPLHDCAKELRNFIELPVA